MASIRPHVFFAVGVVIPVLLGAAAKSCSSPAPPAAEASPFGFSRNHPVIACPLCPEPAYLTGKYGGLDYYGCGHHRIAVGSDDGKIFSAEERDDPELRKRIAAHGLKSFKGAVRLRPSDPAESDSK